MKKAKGFSLLELSVVLLIMGLLFIISFEGSKYFLIQNQNKATHVKMDSIQKSLEIYVRKTGKLPCPTPLFEKTGISVDECDIQNASKGFFVKDDIAIGGVPFRTLDLTSDVSFDSWNGRFIYSVPLKAVESMKELNNGEEIITIYDNESTVSNEVTDEAIYTIISNGSNKFGAFDFKNDKKLDDSKASIDEKINIADGLNPDKAVYFSDPTKGDDIVRYKTSMQLINDAELYDVSCCITQEVVNELIGNLSLDSSEISFGTYTESICSSFLAYSDEVKNEKAGDDVDKDYRLKCFKYGRLGIIKYN